MCPPVLDRLRRLLPGRRRCRAWTPKPQRENHPFFHDPGDCRDCWRPCYNERRPGTAFCDDCWLKLSSHPAMKIRYELLNRSDIPIEYLEHMTNDMDAQVSDAAMERLRTFSDDEELEGIDPFEQLTSTTAGKDR